MTNIKTVEAIDAKEWLDSGEAIIIDVREPEEFAEAHIPGATLIPVGSIDLEKLPELSDKKLIIHCKFGKRGGTACGKLLHAKPDLDVYNLTGGISAWQEAGFKVETE